MTTATTREGAVVTCERDHDLKTLTRKMCRECSLCNHGHNCNNTNVNSNGFDQFFAGKEEDAEVYIIVG